MEDKGGFIQQFIEWIIQNGGLYVLLFVVFAETGLFVGFFLPGDSLLFAAGIYIEDLSKEFFDIHYSFVLVLVILASVLGNIVGYWFGNKTGPLLFERRETWIFKPKYLVRAKTFYDKYGKATIFLAKFLPMIRTFAPIVAGIVNMPKATFLFYNITGSIAWVCSMMLGGYFLQTWAEKEFGISLKDHIEAITVFIVLVTTLPVLYKIFFGKKSVVHADEENDNPVS